MNDREHMMAARKLLNIAYIMASEQIELNPSNYSHDDVYRLNTEAVEIFDILESGIAQLNNDFNDPIVPTGRGVK